MNQTLFNAFDASKSPRCREYNSLMSMELVDSWINGNRSDVLEFLRVTAEHSPYLALLYQAEFVIILATSVDGPDNVRGFLDRMAGTVDREGRQA